MSESKGNVGSATTPVFGNTSLLTLRLGSIHAYRSTLLITEMESGMHSALNMALINLNHPAHFYGIGAVQVSAGNLVIIVSMFVIFAMAIFLPFPHGKDD